MLRFMGSQRVGHDWVNDLIWTMYIHTYIYLGNQLHLHYVAHEFILMSPTLTHDHIVLHGFSSLLLLLVWNFLFQQSKIGSQSPAPVYTNSSIICSGLWNVNSCPQKKTTLLAGTQCLRSFPLPFRLFYRLYSIPKLLSSTPFPHYIQQLCFTQMW